MKTKTKKVFYLLAMLLVFTVLFASCGDNAGTSESETTSIPQIDLDLPTSPVSSDQPYDPGSITVDTETETETESETGTTPTAAMAMTTAKVNMRGEPNGDVVTVLPKGALVELLDVSDSEWYKVSFNGYSGYVTSDYLNTETTATQMDLTGQVSTQTLFVRGTPSSDGTTLGAIYYNETCKIVGAENGWYKIVFENGFGYVSAEYVDILE